MRFIGIDPSTKTGLVVLDNDCNVLDAHEITAPGKDPERMITIIEKAVDGIGLGDHVAIEGFGFASRSGFLLGGIGWGIRMELCAANIDYVEVAPAALKKFAAGKGSVKKDELAVHIFKRWGFESRSDNVRDAYVLARVAHALLHPDGLVKAQQEVIDTIKSPKAKKVKA